MKIQSISNNSFMGKYTYGSDKDGKWWTEYRPYSWENYNHSTAEPKRYIDILSSTLPNNEQLFESRYRNGVLQKEISTDIFGTVTSIYDAIEDTKRAETYKSVSMNREESLKYYVEKLKKFLDMKLECGNQSENTIQKTYNQISELSKDFDKYSTDFNSGILSADRTKQENKDLMVQTKSKIMDKIASVKEQQARIDKLNESVQNLKEQIVSYREELKIIAEARQNARIIDISRRDIEDADRPLLNAMKYDFETLINSLVILPHKTISMQKIFAQMNNNKKFNPALNQDIVRYITHLINFGR